MKKIILSGFIIVAGAIMFSAGATDGTGNSWMNWPISLQAIGGITLLIGLVLGVIDAFGKEVKGIFSKDKSE